jgi:uncharacterized protein YoxC
MKTIALILLALSLTVNVVLVIHLANKTEHVCERNQD